MTSKLKKVWRDESGITVLETAIILLAFVVVASVFAFTILSAGTSEKAETTDADLVQIADETRDAVEDGLSLACKSCLWAEDAENCTGVCGAVSEEGE